MRGHEQNDCTGTRPVSDSGEVALHELYLSRSATLSECTLQIIWELRLARNKIMQVVPQELCASLATVPIEYCEELNLILRLLVAVRLDAWLF